RDGDVARAGHGGRIDVDVGGQVRRVDEGRAVHSDARAGERRIGSVREVRAGERDVFVGRTLAARARARPAHARTRAAARETAGAGRRRSAVGVGYDDVAGTGVGVARDRDVGSQLRVGDERDTVDRDPRRRERYVGAVLEVAPVDRDVYLRGAPAECIGEDAG